MFVFQYYLSFQPLAWSCLCFDSCIDFTGRFLFLEYGKEHLNLKTKKQFDNNILPYYPGYKAMALFLVQVDFSKRQMPLYRKKAGLITGVIR